MSYNIYRINTDGTASWVDTANGDTNVDALLCAYKRHNRHSDPLIRTNETYFVVDPEKNPSNKQCLLQIQHQLIAAVPAALGR